jgi:hypothetical protein
VATDKGDLSRNFVQILDVQGLFGRVMAVRPSTLGFFHGTQNWRLELRQHWPSFCTRVMRIGIPTSSCNGRSVLSK